jgi:HK97 family phage major capsid protein
MARYEEMISRAKQAGEIEDKMRQLDRDLGAFRATSKNGVTFEAYQSPGEVFTAFEGYKSIRNAEARAAQGWTSGPVEVALLTKGTLGETSGGAGRGGGLTPPTWVPGVVSQLFQPLGLADLFPSQQTPASQVRYVVEGTATSSAAGVAEGAAKPESTLGYTEVSEPVRKIGRWSR